MDEKKETEMIFENKVSFVGKENLKPIDKEKIVDLLKKFIGFYVEKFSSESFQSFKIDVDSMNKDGSQQEYEIKILFVTDKGSFHTKKVGWNSYNIFREALEAIENQVFD